MADPFDLARFVEAQATAYARARAELASGEKLSHWMWFIFPQIAGLGRSAMAERYAISSREEAMAFLAHPLLGARLRECAGLVLAVEGRTLRAIFGAVDAEKFRSSMTLFAAVAPEEPVFRACLDKYCDGADDPATLERL